MMKEEHAAARWAPLGTAGDGRAPRAWPRYMTARVAADYADSSPWTIRRHVRPCGRRGRLFVYAIESVEEWMRGAAAKREEAPVGTRSPASKSQPRKRDRTPHARARDVIEASHDDVAA